MMFVRNQNGALAEAVRVWKRNFDKEFEGVEECPICYSVIHTVNHSLPRLACKTCKHKFHAACLYKWFSTSHKSSCPLCHLGTFVSRILLEAEGGCTCNDRFRTFTAVIQDFADFHQTYSLEDPSL
ncbi:hypothetical protein V6N11_009316 [Hibiscus sabdariffa]|uniref:E3 ubiquitin-protein ligase listerin n=1 Tax=Hibiscus sabdariffa TaxID=183260 RepID=A0ABR2PQ94_9ROSI